MDIKIELLSHLIRKIVLKKFEDIDEAFKDKDRFKEELKTIKKWNVTEIEDEVENIKQKCSKINEFLINIIQGISNEVFKCEETCDTINLSLFIHKIYINMGGYLYHRPEIMKKKTTPLGEKVDLLDIGLKNSIRKSIFDVFPLLKVLEKEIVEDESSDDSDEQKKTIDDYDNESEKSESEDSYKCSDTEERTDPIVIKEKNQFQPLQPQPTPTPVPVQQPVYQPTPPVVQQTNNYQMLSDSD